MASHVDSVHDLLDLDIQTLRQFIDLFPSEGLSKVLTGYLSSGISRYPLAEKYEDAPDLSEGGVALDQHVPLSQEDCLVLMTVGRASFPSHYFVGRPCSCGKQDGILDAKSSPLAHCLLGDYYLSLEEYEIAVETTRKGLKLAAAESKKIDLSFQR